MKLCPRDRVQVTQEWTENGSRKLHSQRINGQELFALSYNDWGQVDAVHRAKNPVDKNDTFQYDTFTRSMTGFARFLGDQSFSTAWNFNTRGLLSDESYRFREQSLNRNYFYSPHRLLTGDKDQLNTNTYSYN